MSQARHENQVVTLLEAIQANVEARNLAYTETFAFPAFDLGTGPGPAFEIDPTYRAKVLWMGIRGLSEAIANDSNMALGVGGGDVDAYIEELTPAATGANTGADDQDASLDLERSMLPGASRVIPASQLVTITVTDPGTDGTGIAGELYVVLGYFE